jgi:CRISPR-associated protein Cas8a1/Csx13
MAKTKNITVSLSSPGMSVFHRAGVGGLAASLYALACDLELDWEDGVTIPLGPGTATVHQDHIDLDFGEDTKATLTALSEYSFQIKDGLVYLPGAAKGSPEEVRLGLHRAYTATFLQHPLAKKYLPGATRVIKDPNDEDKTAVCFEDFRGVKGYKHQKDLATGVLAAVKKGSVQLSGIVLPGAAGPWIAQRQKNQSYTPEHALAAFFVMVGTPVWYNGVGTKSFKGGAMLVPAPTDLIKFGRGRHRLTPDTYRGCINGGFGSCALATHLRISSDWREAFGPALVVEFGPVAWDSHQTWPIAVTEVTIVSDDKFVALADVADLLPRDTDLFKFASRNVASGKVWWNSLISFCLETKKGPVFLADAIAMGDDFGYKMSTTLFYLKGTMTPDQQTTIDALQRTWRFATSQLNEAGGWNKVDNKRAEIGRAIRQSHDFSALLGYIAGNFVARYGGYITPKELESISSLTFSSLQTCFFLALTIRSPKKDA